MKLTSFETGATTFSGQRTDLPSLLLVNHINGSVSALNYFFDSTRHLSRVKRTYHAAGVTYQL
jgi:hypothetical protein